jgi:hypothetical protein
VAPNATAVYTDLGIHFITELIKEYRLKYIQELLDFFHTQVTDRSARPGDGSVPGHACKRPNGTLCDATILGNIWRGMLRNGREGLFPKQADEIAEESIGSLLAVLSESLKMPQELEWGYGIYHEHCSPQRAFEEIENRLWDTSEWRERLLQDHDKEHMARQRQILGLDMGDSVVNGDHEVRA